jgi:hypothetical protein
MRDERGDGHEYTFGVDDQGQSLDERFPVPPAWDPHSTEEGFYENADMHGASAEGDGHGERRVRRRLNSKTPAHATAYVEGTLLTRREAIEQRHERAAKRRRVATDSRNVEAQAWALLEARVRLAGDSQGPLEVPTAGSSGSQRANDTRLAEASGGAEAVPEAGPNLHASHDIRKAVNLNVVFCNVCGAWSSGIRGRKLVEPCEGRCKHPTSLRLLQVGVYPSAGARLPPQLRQPGARGTRRPRW